MSIERYIRRTRNRIRIMIASKPYIVAVFAFITLLALFSFRGTVAGLWQNPKYYNGKQAVISTVPAKLDVGSKTTELGRASNGTLGFEKVLVVGLRERTDRRDVMAVQSSLTGFHVDWVDGVKGEDIPDKALPPGMDRGIMWETYIGSWRGHMNAVRRVLDDKLSTALIMEDDVDWDVRLLAQMQDFAKGVRYLQEVSTSIHQHSPYGDDWDILWPGHCGEVLPTDDNRRYIIENDETVADKAHQPWLKALAEYPENTRMVHKTGAPICTFAYAVSARGAEKILMGLALKGQNLNLDNALAYLCRDGYLNIKCYSVQPMLFYHHRPAGSVGKDSDMKKPGADTTKVREKGFTENIVWSARLNLDKLVTGKTDYTMQW